MASKVINESEIKTYLKKVPKWEVVKSKLSESTSSHKTELKRVYKFETFKNSIEYIHKMAEKAEEHNHHPRFESSYVKLTVWLCTADQDNQLTNLDFELAASLEELYQN